MLSLLSSRISVRIAAGYAAVIALVLALVAVVVWSTERVHATVHLMETEAELLSLAEQWNAHVRQNTARTLAIARAANRDMVDFFKEPIAEVTRQTTATQKAFLEKVAGLEARRLVDQIGEVRKEYIAVRDDVARLKAAGDEAGVQRAIAEQMAPVTDRYLKTTGDLAAHQLSRVRAAASSVDRAFDVMHLWIAAAVAACVLLATGLTWTIARGISRPLRHAVSCAERIGAGDLSQPIKCASSDETSQVLRALAAAQNSLARAVHEVRSTVDQVSTASTQIATGNQDLSARTEQQASNLQQTAASMEQMTHSVRNNADSAHRANELAASASQVAQKGGTVVQQVVVTMGEITDSSRQIAEIISVIDGIAFQTNILALNAAVEAARAGEQGRGFAVVAAEVRTLARRSADAAREIKSLINHSVEKVEAGSALVDAAGQTMSEIVTQVRQVTDLISEINSATLEQSNGIGQVNQAVTQLDQMTQQNAALVEESAAAAQSLSEQARKLSASVGQFRLDLRSAA